VVDVLRHISWRSWAVLLATAACAVAGVILTARWAAEPSWAAVARAQDAADVVEATNRLDRYGIRWSLRERGQVLAVDRGREAEARRLLAGTVLPARARPNRRGGGDPVARRLESGLNDMIDRTIGADRARVAATVVVDWSRRRAVRDGYGPRGPAVVDEAEISRLEGDFARGAREARRAVWAVDREQTWWRFATGRVQRITLALVIDPSVDRRTARSLRRAVATGAGLRPARGDRMWVSRLALREPNAGESAAPRWAWLVYAPWAMLLVGCMLLARWIGRDLREARAAAAYTA
jgi:flagellar biosynthesis/type III secretory pathway M-ring protein FliF/YscJ